ncbi:growth/differentiation factor 10-like [Solea senegalensis]|uniref:Growth/differentiation factor 10 n=1 Tax=Solea senegalensis TaxID=28829 RepID=A0AAV6S6D5_SOLSE|nr:growth/differentiation factor 10 [Solea senegalensis]KAG7512903.1 growth/differentiation factor 10-like [Solea senegalensis]
MMPSHLCMLVLNCFLGAASSVRVTKGRTQDRSFPLSASEPLSDDLDQGMVFQHMSKLYEKYNRENRLREGNTVRSVRAIQAFSDHRTVYQLNLTTLQDSEVILSATFHFLHERHPHQKPWFCKRFRSASCRPSAIHPSISLLFHSISSGPEVRSRSLGSLLGNVTFHPHRRGVWQMKDVTQVIKEAWDEGHRLVSVELDLGQHNKRKTEEALSAGDLPYLLVYADDQALAEPNSVAASLQRYDPFSDEGEITQSSQLLHRPIISPESKERVRREAALPSDLIQNNELPEVDYKPDGYRKDDLWESAWYLKLKPKSGRKEEKRKSQDEEAVVESGGEHDRDQLQVLKGGGRTSHDDSTVKLFKDSRTRTISDGRKHERRNEGKDVKKNKGRSNTQSPVLSFDEQTMRNARRRQWSNSQHKGCSRRNLRVDFADIGWSEWVIAPKAFEAYYCAGTCGFPMPKVSRPSNHATIQSIVRAVGIIPGVPEPCCVPEKMSPLGVLYQDESRNPVLKIYPNMSIQSCSCR